MMQAHETLRLIALGDERLVQQALDDGSSMDAASGLDAKTFALVRLGAQLAMEAPVAAYRSTVRAARAAGAGDQEIVGCTIAVAPAVGAARFVLTAAHLACALGQDVPSGMRN